MISIFETAIPIYHLFQRLVFFRLCQKEPQWNLRITNEHYAVTVLFHHARSNETQNNPDIT